MEASPTPCILPVCEGGSSHYHSNFLKSSNSFEDLDEAHPILDTFRIRLHFLLLYFLVSRNQELRDQTPNKLNTGV